MPAKIKVAAAQILTHYDIGENLKKIVQSINDAARQKCRIIAFHEGCLPGYRTSGRHLRQLDFKKLAKAETEIVKLAKRKKISVLLGSVSRDRDHVYNDVLIVNEKGTVLGRYAKTWRAGEPWFTAGPGPVIFRVSGVEATVIICHDLRYPELPRLAVAAGAKIVFIVNNESNLARENKLLGYRSMQISRATENFVYSVMVNATSDPAGGALPGYSHGNTKIVDPLGNVLDEAGYFEQRLVTATLDLSKATRGPVLRTIGRNPDSNKLYKGRPENETYTRWIREGLKMVRRLDGVKT